MIATAAWLIFWQEHYRMPDLNTQILQCEATGNSRQFHAIAEFFGYRIVKPKARHKKRK
jgi:hypothetical protein